MIILIGDYFITSQVFNLVFQGETRTTRSTTVALLKKKNRHQESSIVLLIHQKS